MFSFIKFSIQKSVWTHQEYLSRSSSLSLQELAFSLKVSFLETSARSSDNVERAFLTMASEIHKRLASEEVGIQGEMKEASAQSAKISSAPLWLGGEKQTQEASNCCWAEELTRWWHDYSTVCSLRCDISNTPTCLVSGRCDCVFWMNMFCQNSDIFAIELKT